MLLNLKLPKVFYNVGQRWLPWLLCAAVSVLLIHFKFGIQVLNPQHTAWLYILNSDWIQHYFGWTYFRQADWTFPPGMLSGYGYPMVSSIGYTDAIPLFAFLFKSISSWLPPTFQYFGWWFLVSYFLQGWFGWKLLQTLFTSRLAQVLGTVLFMLAPVLLARTGHPALCAQWTLLALMWSYYRPQKFEPKAKTALAVILIAAMIHPYLLAMNMALYIAVLLQARKSQSLSWVPVIKYLSLGLTGAALIFYLIGYFLIPSDRTAGSGAGHFSANLNALFNPMDTSSWLPAWPLATSGQYEGYGYLGLGVLSMALWTIYLYRRQWYSFIAFRSASSILLVTVILLFIFALSPVVTLMSHKLLELPLRNYFTQTFRSSGRFIWPLHYFILWMMLQGLLTWPVKRWVSSCLLGLILFLQVTELRPLLKPHYIDHQAKLTGGLTAELWGDLLDHAQRLWVFPPYQPKIRFEGDIIYFQHLAMQRNLPLSTGTFARRDDREAKARQDTIENQLAGLLPSKAGDVFLCGPQHLDLIKAAGETIVLDEYIFFVPEPTLRQDSFWASWLGKHPEIRLSGKKLFKLEDYLQLYQDYLVLLSIKDEASQSLCASTKSFFNTAHSKLSGLAFRGSYAGAWYGGKPVREALDNQQAVTLGLVTQDINPAWPAAQIILHSAGNAVGNTASINLGGQEFSPNLRGFNILVVDSSVQVVRSFNFDTYQSCYQFQ